MNKKKKSTNTSPYPDEVIDRLARAFYPAILACWNSEEGQREFAAWQAEQAHHTTNEKQEVPVLMMDEDHFLHLTDVGREVAEQIYEKHRFFTDRLIEAGVDPVTAEKDACRMEHVISQESFERLRDAYKTKKE